MAKVRIQARTADAGDDSEQHPGSYHHEHSKHAGALDILARVWKREGFVGWYQVCPSTIMRHRRLICLRNQGMKAQIIKAVLSQALLFMSKEQFEHWALAIMIFATRFSTAR